MSNTYHSQPGTFAELEREARARARSQRGVTSNLYNPGGKTQLTEARAVAEALEANPEIYEAYRAAHNAADIVGRLQAAGVKLTKVA